MRVKACRGFVLLELLVAMAIATLLAIWGVSLTADRISDAAVQASAVWMASVKSAVASYVGRYQVELAQADTQEALFAQGYANWSTPTLSELKADGLLSPGFPEQNNVLAGARVQLRRYGVCPGATCRVEALIYSAQPLALRQAQAYAPQMVAQWLLATNGNGGHVKAAMPSRVAGPAFDFPNPPAESLGSLPVGTVAMAVTNESLAHIAYLQQHDTRDPYFQGGATINGPVVASDSVDVQGYVSLGMVHSAYGACPNNGAVAREDVGGLLVCRSNRWRPAGGRGGGGYSISSLKGCLPAAINPVTGTCACSDYAVPVLISDNGANVPDLGRVRGYLCVG